MATLFGSQPSSEGPWAPGVRLSSAFSVPAEEWEVDPSLPPLGQDPRFPSDQIVIPAGRLIGIVADTISSVERARLTLADGSTVRPIGYAESNFFRKPAHKMQWMPLLSLGDVIEVPYVSAINGAYGALAGGTPITAFYGSVSSTTPAPQHVGKIVKWVERRVYSLHQAANPAAVLAAATLPAFRPTIILAMNNGTVVATGASAVPTWNGSAWAVTFGNAVTDVVYEYGQGAEMRCGEVIRVEPINSSHKLHGWLEWVTVQYPAEQYADMVKRVPATAVSNETPDAISSGLYRLQHYPVAAWLPITVKLTGSVVNPDGSTSTYNGEPLAMANISAVDYTRGVYYTIDALTGMLRLSNNVTVTALAVDYSYETSYRSGQLWGGGIPQLTDGRYTGVPGTPANLEVAGSVGSLRCIIR